MDDYCHPCRRHLNGALACPGCGTPEEAVRAYGESIAAQEAAVEGEDEHEGIPARIRSHRLSRSRRRGRTLLAAAGLALAVGGTGFGVVELGGEPSGDGATTQAAPDTSAAPTKDADTTSPSATAGRTTPPASRASRTSSAPAPASPRPDRTRSAGPVDAEVTRRATPAPNTSEARTSASSRPTPSPSRSASATATAEPSPSESCERFLWWCT
ncbi:SCO2400 family protein [Streptomyces sp. NBC_00356]|uniref:SCO2400 family protein n=1 Tax=Streptomyces sp. NBC_00356 TaxID=2975724 RepID=UPI002E264613